MTDFDDDLLAALRGDDNDKPKRSKLEDLVPQKIYITDRCLSVGQRIGPITKDIDGRSMEVGGFYLTDADDDSFTLSDFIIPPKLVVGQSHIIVAEHYDAAVEEVHAKNADFGKNYRMISMFHIHPTQVGGLAHSHFDDMALTTLVNRMARNTRRVYDEPFKLIEESTQRESDAEGYTLSGDSETDGVLRFSYPSDEAFSTLVQKLGITKRKGSLSKKDFLAAVLESLKTEMEEPRIVNFALSLVFNNGGAMPFVKMGMEESFPLTGRKRYATLENVPLEVINYGENIPTDDEIRSLVQERVIFPVKPKPFDFKGWRGRRKGQSTHSIDQQFPSGMSSEIGAESRYYGTHTSPIPPKAKDEVEKVSDQKYTLEEVATLFTLSAYAYVTEHRHAHCKYSLYITALMDYLLEYNTTIGKVKKDQSKDHTNVGVFGAVTELGTLVEDPSSIEVQKPQPYRIGLIADYIKKELQGPFECRDETINFLFTFINGSTLERNQALENYVGYVHQQQ